MAPTPNSSEPWLFHFTAGLLQSTHLHRYCVPKAAKPP